MSARHFLADDDGNVLVNFDGEQFWIGEPFDMRGPRPGELLMRDEYALTRITDKDNLRRDVTFLESVLEDAALYIENEHVPGWIWYHWQTAGEEMKRALLYGGLVKIPSRGRMRTPNLHADVVEPLLELDRHRYFESPAPVSVADTGLTVVGSVVAVTGKGTADGRVSRFIMGEGGGASDGLTRLWAGFRETGHGTDDFAPIWDLYDGNYGYAGSDASGIASDANAYNGHSVEIDFSAVDDEQGHLFMTLDSVSGITDYRHQAGKYLILARWAGTSAKEFSIRLAQSINGENPIYCERKYVTGAGTGTYNVLPLGIVDVPPIAAKENWTSAKIGRFTLTIYAATFGAINDKLRFNTLTFIPVGRALTTEDAKIEGSGREAVMACLPTDRWTAWYQTSSTEQPLGGMSVNAPKFFVPRDGGILVMAAARAASQVYSDTFDMELEYYHRHRTYRRADEASW